MKFLLAKFSFQKSQYLRNKHIAVRTIRSYDFYSFVDIYRKTHSFVCLCLFLVFFTVNPVFNGHPMDPKKCPLNRGVRLIQVHFTEN